MTRERDISENRGVSDVVGVAILIALSIVGSLVIVAVGGIALNSVTDQAQSDLADDSLRNVNARLSSLAESPVDATTEFTFPEGTGDRIEANASAGDVYINATTASGYRTQTVEYAEEGDSRCTVDQDMGAIVHEQQNGNKMVYQGGGLWKQTPAGVQVESPPRFDYDGSAITFGFINITQLDSIEEGETLTARKDAAESQQATANITRQLQDCWRLDGASGTVPVTVNVTIQSKYSEGWARYAKNGMAADLNSSQVTWDNASNEVTLHFGKVGNQTGVFSNSSDFPPDVIYAGLSDYARYNNNLTASGSGFTVDPNPYSAAFFDKDAGQWVYATKGSVTSQWEYVNRTGVSVSKLEEVDVTNSGGDNVFEFDDGTPICMLYPNGKGNIRDTLSNGNCTAAMVGVDGDEIGVTEEGYFNVSIDSVADSGVTEGDDLDVTVTITNNGTAKATKDVGLYAQDNDAGTRTLVAYKELTLGAHSSNNTWSGTLTWTTGSNAAEADEMLVATEDTYEFESVSIADASTTDVDFAVDSVSASPSTVTVGDPVTVTADIENQNGTGGSQWVWLEDTNGNIVNATNLTLSPNGDKSVSLTYTPAQPTSGNVKVKTADDNGTDAIDVNRGSGSGGVVYVGRADGSGAQNYFKTGNISVDKVYQRDRNGGGPTCKKYGSPGHVCDPLDGGASQRGYILDMYAPNRDSGDYKLYVGNVTTGNWELARPTEALDDRAGLVHSDGTDPSELASKTTNGDVATFYMVENSQPVCIAEEGSGVNPDKDCGPVYNTSGGLDYDDSENVLEVESKKGNLSVLTAQVGQRVEQRDSVRKPLDVFFVLDESGSMGRYEGSGTAYPGNTYSPPEGYFYKLDTGSVYDSDESFTVENRTTVYVYSGSDPLGFRIDATKSFVGSLNDSKDEAGALQFDSYANVVQPLTGDLDEVNSSISNNAGGATYIGRAIDTARNELTAASDPDRQVMVLLSDGKADDDPIPAARRAARENITIYTIGLGDDVNARELKRIANITGGSYYYVDKADQLDRVFDQVAKDVQQQSVIQRSRTEVSAVTDSGTEYSVSLDGDANLNDPSQYNTSSSTAIEKQISRGLNNSDLSFKVTVYGCNNYTTVDGVTSTINGTTYTHTTCTNYDRSDKTTLTNANTNDHVIITANNSNDLSDISASGAWQPEPEAVSPLNKSDLGPGEALVGLEVSHKNQSGYVLLYFEVPVNKTVNNRGDLGSTKTANFQIQSVSGPSNVKEGEKATITTEVKNTGDEAATQSLALRQGGFVANSTAVTLSPGNDTTVDLVWNSSGTSTGNTTLTAVTRDDSGTHTVDVDGLGTNFKVKSLSTNTTSIDEGHTLVVDATIKNTGNVSGKQLVSLEEKVGGDWRVVDVKTVDLDKQSGADNDADITLTWDTGPGDAGNRTIRVRTQDRNEKTQDITVNDDSGSGSGFRSNVGDSSGDPVSIDVSRIDIE